MSHISRLALISVIACVSGLALTTNDVRAENLLQKAAVEVREVDMPSNFDYSSENSIRLSMDKSKIIRLKDDAASVLVGNPNHASVLAESPRLLVVIPRMAGATHITVLNKKGEVILDRHVLVAAPQQQYLRIRRSCAGAGERECAPTRTYYCPNKDMCHEIASVDTEGDSGTDSGGAAGAAAQSGEDIGPSNASGSE